MAEQDAFALGRSNLNGFLFADIGIEGNGMPLSVMSALAREGLDPWQEAGRLARLPRATARDGLARLIAAMPASLWPLADATAIAARLVTLLPGHDERPHERSVSTQNVLSSLLEDKARRRGPWLVGAALALAVLVVVAAFLGPAPAVTAGIGPVVAASGLSPTPGVTPISQVPIGD